MQIYAYNASPQQATTGAAGHCSPIGLSSVARKRKLKRMVLDGDMSLPSTSVGAQPGGVGGSVSALRRKRSKMQGSYADSR